MKTVRVALCQADQTEWLRKRLSRCTPGYLPMLMNTTNWNGPSLYIAAGGAGGLLSACTSVTEMAHHKKAQREARLHIHKVPTTDVK